MPDQGLQKNMRLLQLYTRLGKGEHLRKPELAREFGVNEKSIQRDIEDLRNFFVENEDYGQELVYNQHDKCYCLRHKGASALSDGELLAVVKILLESRSLPKAEMYPLIDTLVACCATSPAKKQLSRLMANEKFHYIEPHHGKQLTERLWEIGDAIANHHVLEMTYGQKLKQKETVNRRVEPVGLLFSEYYFYLAAFIQEKEKIDSDSHNDGKWPTLYRVDRIQSLHNTGKPFTVPYASRFEEGEMRKRIQFMYAGPLQKVKFRYTGPSIEAVLDRLPTARILEEKDGVYVVEAEVFGTGIDMWLRSQGGYVERMA